MKSDYGDLYDDWTFAVFEWSVMNYFSSPYGYFWQNWHIVAFLKSASFFSKVVQSHSAHTFSYVTLHQYSESYLLLTEAATGGVLCKVFLEISQNS